MGRGKRKGEYAKKEGTGNGEVKDKGEEKERL